MSEIQGSLVNFKVRVNGSGAPFKKMVCTEDTTFTITNGTSTRKTNCGPIAAVSVAEFNASGNAVFNFEPGGTEVSWDEVKAWQKAKTKLDFTYENDADVPAGITQGEAVSVLGSGYFTESAFTASAEDDGIGSFSWTFTGTGTLDSYAV